MKKAIIIGLTGQTGSGKSTVCKMLKKYGYYAIDADAVSKGSLYDENAISKLKGEFGYDITDENGCLKRKLLANRAFQSPEKTKILNDITHPLILEEMIKKANEAFMNGYDRVIFDAPLLLSCPELMEKCKLIICVKSSEENRRKRIRERDNLSDEEVSLRINVQESEEYYLSKSDIIIDNDEKEDQLKEKVEETVSIIEDMMEEEDEWKSQNDN